MEKCHLLPAADARWVRCRLAWRFARWVRASSATCNDPRARSRGWRCKHQATCSCSSRTSARLPRFYYYFDEDYPRSDRRVLPQPSGGGQDEEVLRFLCALSAHQLRRRLALLPVDAGAQRRRRCSGINAYCQAAGAWIGDDRHDRPGFSWGLYIANFTFLVGMAAAAVMLVIPVYIYRNRDLHDLVIFGELFAVAAILMCLAFVTGGPGTSRRAFMHLLLAASTSLISMLAWDVVVAGRLPAAQPAHLRLSGLLRLLPTGTKLAKFLYPLRVRRDRRGRSRIHTVTAFLLCRAGSPAVLEHRDPRAALLGVGVRRRACIDHHHAAGDPPFRRTTQVTDKALALLRNIVTVALDRERFPADL
jgi:hypothetical protein